MAENNNYDIYLDGCKLNIEYMKPNFWELLLMKILLGRNILKMFVNCAQEALEF